MKKNILFLPVILLINACSSLPEIDSQLQSRQWINHQVLVSDLRSWNIKGRAAIQNKYNSGTFVLHWNQHDTDFELRFISSFRQGTYLLKGSETEVTMHTPKMEVLTAITPEKLIRDELGWDVNLAGLKYWIRGIPEPNSKYSQLLLDEKGRLQDMKQSGFTISILRYTDKKNISLPEKLFIKSKDIELRLVIQNWEI